jgi:hypothetical protein
MEFSSGLSELNFALWLSGGKRYRTTKTHHFVISAFHHSISLKIQSESNLDWMQIKINKWAVILLAFSSIPKGDG